MRRLIKYEEANVKAVPTWDKSNEIRVKTPKTITEPTIRIDQEGLPGILNLPPRYTPDTPRFTLFSETEGESLSNGYLSAWKKVSSVGGVSTLTASIFKTKLYE